MRNILFFTLALFMTSFVIVEDNYKGNAEKSYKEQINKEELLRNVIRNCSIVNMVEHKDFILYQFGHDGYNWSLVADADSCYMVVAGSSINGVINVDSLPKHDQLLSWSFDSLPEKALNMKPIHHKTYFPIYRRLIAYTDNGNRIFDMNDAIGYEGADSASFNKELGRLSYFMLWQALHGHQDKMPMPD